MNSKLKLALSVVGYILGAAAGVAGIVAGIMQSEAGFIVIGVAFLAAVVVAFIAGATATPKGGLPPKIEFGGKFTPPDWAWYIAAGIIVVGLIVGGILLAI
ncbi:hypothetical protein ACLQ2Q_18370 [Microbacterium sp. DT81.1]|uniref:hypothetical protein n=1 Tax=Microbacterium sp. DT81.1 TaxID=3393413 RepID=UPI003CFB2890